LGQIRDKISIEALKRALKDAHPAVRSAALIALSKTKDPGLTSLFKKYLSDPNTNVRQAAKQALKILKKDSSFGKKRFLIGLGGMGSKLKVKNLDIKNLLQDYILKELKNNPKVIILAESTSQEEIRKLIQRNGLLGYFIEGSLTRLETLPSSDEVEVKCKISLMVMDNLTKDLKMMLSGSASVIDEAYSFNPKKESAMQKMAIKAAVNATISRLWKILNQITQRE
jgi:hypothetical protein